LTDYIIDLIRIMLTGIPLYILARALLLWRRSRRLGARRGVKKVKLEYNKLREICLGLFVVFMMALMTFVLQGDYMAPEKMLAFGRNRLMFPGAMDCCSCGKEIGIQLDAFIFRPCCRFVLSSFSCLSTGRWILTILY